LYTVHDGKQTPHSTAQQELINTATDVVNITVEERARQAMGLWEQEKGFAGVVLATGWLLKIYFAYLLYSFALHLRNGTYRSLPGAQYARIPEIASQDPYAAEEFELDDRDLYRGSTPNSAYRSRTPATATSFAEFVVPPTPVTKR